MKELIMKAFTDYLGMALEDMDEIGKNLYSPDYEIFEAGWLAATRSNGVANNQFDLTQDKPSQVN